MPLLMPVLVKHTRTWMDRIAVKMDWRWSRLKFPECINKLLLQYTIKIAQLRSS